jgi:uncharacterized protein
LTLPRRAAWRHAGARDGFEVVFCDERRFEGTTAAVEGGDAWVVEYRIALDERWRTQSAQVASLSAAGRCELTLRCEPGGRWTIDGEHAPDLDGCLDVDLESSALTNAFPVNRLGLEAGEQAEAPAAYVRALDLGVERLEQRYLRLDDSEGRSRYRYSAPRFEFECELAYDESGLVLDYPGIATRAGSTSSGAERRSS